MKASVKYFSSPGRRSSTQAHICTAFFFWHCQVILLKHCYGYDYGHAQGSVRKYFNRHSQARRIQDVAVRFQEMENNVRVTWEHQHRPFYCLSVFSSHKCWRGKKQLRSRSEFFWGYLPSYKESSCPCGFFLIFMYEIDEFLHVAFPFFKPLAFFLACFLQEWPWTPHRPRINATQSEKKENGRHHLRSFPSPWGLSLDTSSNTSLKPSTAGGNGGRAISDELCFIRLNCTQPTVW